MATKTQQIPQDNTGSSVLSQLPPSISPTTSVLASIIPLPQHPLIAYSTFTCVSATLDQLEVARRSVLLRNRGKSLTDSLLPCVNIGKESSVLYVFALGSTQHLCDAYQLLSKLELEGLTCECVPLVTRSRPEQLAASSGCLKPLLLLVVIGMVMQLLTRYYSNGILFIYTRFHLSLFSLLLDSSYSVRELLEPRRNNSSSQFNTVSTSGLVAFTVDVVPPSCSRSVSGRHRRSLRITVPWSFCNSAERRFPFGTRAILF